MGYGLPERESFLYKHETGCEVLISKDHKDKVKERRCSAGYGDVKAAFEELCKHESETEFVLQLCVVIVLKNYVHIYC